MNQGDRQCTANDIAEEIMLDEAIPQDLQNDQDDMDDGTPQDGGEETLEDFVDDSIQVYRLV
jgi:hypothetical protein